MRIASAEYARFLRLVGVQTLVAGDGSGVLSSQVACIERRADIQRCGNGVGDIVLFVDGGRRIVDVVGNVA